MNDIIIPDGMEVIYLNFYEAAQMGLSVNENADDTSKAAYNALRILK